MCKVNQFRESLKSLGKLDTRFTIKKPFVICSTTLLGDKTYKGIGISRCSPKDSWDEQLGKEIARGRAIKALYLKVNKKHFNSKDYMKMG